MLRLDWNIVFTIINILVLYWILRRFLLKPVMGIIEKRQGMIDSQLADAQDKQNQAEDLQRQYAQVMSGAQQESADILDQAKNRASKEYNKKVEEADQQAALILKQAKQTIETERQQVLRDLKTEISQLAMLSAEKIITGQSTKKLNQGIYKQFLAKAGEENDSD